ncbi:MAG: 3-deoxy-7-phosphoheptulonate synthase [bacterium]|nr:3-deoxy-7-phosphoheptulonate synthase [bacterium]
MREAAGASGPRRRYPPGKSRKPVPPSPQRAPVLRPLALLPGRLRRWRRHDSWSCGVAADAFFPVHFFREADQYGTEPVPVLFARERSVVRTENIRVRSLTPLISPLELKQVFPQTTAMAEHVAAARHQIKAIMRGDDRRLLAVVGPCSIHDADAALEYARRLAALAAETAPQLFVVMRVYFEKPRTTVGWKGLINDPDLNGSQEISKGLGIARRLLCEINGLGVPVACEMLDTVTPEYLADMIAWGAIGARTVESQTHREMASGLSFPVGFKNGTDGNLKVAMDGMRAAGRPHSFLGVNGQGHNAIVRTLGNEDVHMVLRGGGGRTNFGDAEVADAVAQLRNAGLTPGVMVDCSHANSGKDHERQRSVLEDVVGQVCDGNGDVRGVMIESNLEAGGQKIPEDLGDLRYGVSITDKCVDWATTEGMLREATARLSG